MGLNATHTVAELELSPAAYDEIERKLLDAGYDHCFERGPGSMIDMSGIAVTRQQLPSGTATGRGFGSMPDYDKLGVACGIQRFADGVSVKDSYPGMDVLVGDEAVIDVMRERGVFSSKK